MDVRDAGDEAPSLPSQRYLSTKGQRHTQDLTIWAASQQKMGNKSKRQRVTHYISKFCIYNLLDDPVTCIQNSGIFFQ